MIPYRATLQWFALALSYATALFFAVQYGVIAATWHTDFTYITSVIAVLFVICVTYIGHATWVWDRAWYRIMAKETITSRTTKANAATGLMRSASYALTLLGLLGTIIGLMAQVKSMGSIDLSNPQNIVAFIGTIASSLATALYCTAAGIVASVGLTFMNSNLEYFLDLEDNG